MDTEYVRQERIAAKRMYVGSTAIRIPADRREPFMEEKILKTLVFFSDDQKSIVYRVDTIEHAGKTWLVPGWFNNPQEGCRLPERIICLDALPHEKTSWSQADFVLNKGIPKSVFDGQVSPEQNDQYIVVEKPDIRFPAIGS